MTDPARTDHAQDSSGSRHGFRSLADLLAGGPPAIDWLVEDLFPLDSLGVIAAQPKSFKSFLGLDLALSVATGTRFLDTFAVARQGPVVLVVGEGGETSLRRRAWAKLESIGGTAADVTNVPVTTRAIDLMDGSAMADLAAVTNEVRPVLIEVDPLYPGFAQVQTSQLAEVGRALRRLEAIGREVGAAIVVVHHTAKAADRKGLGRLSGAGVAEWGSVFLLGTPLPPVPGQPRVVRWEHVARDLPGLDFRTTFDLGTVEEPRYRVHVQMGEGSDGVAAELSYPEQRVYSSLAVLGPQGGSLSAINDLLAADGHPMRYETLRPILERLVELGLVDGADGNWWVIPATAGAGA